MKPNEMELSDWVGEMLDAGALVALAAIAQVAQEREIQAEAQQQAPQIVEG